MLEQMYLECAENCCNATYSKLPFDSISVSVHEVNVVISVTSGYRDVHHG